MSLFKREQIGRLDLVRLSGSGGPNVTEHKVIPASKFPVKANISRVKVSKAINMGRSTMILFMRYKVILSDKRRTRIIK